MNTIVELVFQYSDPSIRPHTWPYRVDCRFGTVVANLVQALLHGALELICDLSVPVSMEDAPGFHGRLGEHLGLDLTIYLTSIALDVEGIWSSTVGGTHNQIASFVLVSRNLGWILIELEMPLLLLLDTLLVGGEGGEEVLALLDLLVSVGVHYLGQVLHQPEVRTHCIC